MNLGVLDLPAPLLASIDSAMSAVGVPALLRVLAWGLVGGSIGMWLYRRYSPQARIADVRAGLRTVQKELADYDGEFSGLRRLIGRQFGLVFTQLRLTFGAALLAGLPVLLILPWLSNAYDARQPEPGHAVVICATPVAAATALRWSDDVIVNPDGCRTVAWPATSTPLQLSSDATPLLEFPMQVPARIVHRRGALNWLIGNPAGYLPEASPVQVVTIALPATELITMGPGWLRGWEAAFFSAALLLSLWLRWRWKLN